MRPLRRANGHRRPGADPLFSEISVHYERRGCGRRSGAVGRGSRVGGRVPSCLIRADLDDRGANPHDGEPRRPAQGPGRAGGNEEMMPNDQAPSRPRVLVTGATGLLGSHLAEQLTAQGDRVLALVRPGSRTEFLESLGVEIVRGDLTDPRDCDAATAGVAQVYHCAAKVGDWGTWPEFQRGCMDATRTLAESAGRSGV